MARKRKDRNDIAETLIPDSRNTSDNTRGEEEEEEVFNDDEEEEEAVKGFFACYLLCSLSPRFKGHTYIGFTVNPRRRIRQHNGEITSGAWRTKRKRPWEMVLCVYGFPTNVSALQFEWAWQHPTESLAVRKAAATLKSLSGIANKIKLVYLMLTLPPWQSLKLTVNFFSTKYTTHSVGCPNLPKQMKVKVGPIDELPCYAEGNRLLDENDEDDHFEGDENDSGHHPDIPLYNISKTIAHAQLRGNAGDHERQLFYHADSPVRIPVLSTMRLGGTATTIEGADSVSFSEEKNSGDSRQATKSQMATSTLTKFDQNPPTGNHNFTSEFGFELQNGKEDHRAQFSSIDSLVEEPCDSITSFVNTVETDKCRNSLGLFEDTGKVRQPMKQKLTTEASATVEKQSQVAVSTYFSSETGSRLQHDEPFILREEDHRETFNITDSPPSSSCITVPNEVTTLEDKIPCRLFQGNTRKTGRAGAKLKATVLKDDDEQPLSSNSLLSPGVEVINVLTPSSECTMPPFRRKKRASLVNRHEIIDLTNSPGCIQL